MRLTFQIKLRRRGRKKKLNKRIEPLNEEMHHDICFSSVENKDPMLARLSTA